MPSLDLTDEEIKCLIHSYLRRIPVSISVDLNVYEGLAHKILNYYREFLKEENQKRKFQC